MSQQYQDKDGVVVTAQQIVAPTVLNTINGEIVGESGQWVVTLPNGSLAIVDAETFVSSFTALE